MPPGGTTHTIEMQGGFQFVPRALTIAVGDTVRAHNADSAHHTFTDSGVFDSGDVGPGGAFSYRFTRTGTFNFVCTYHQGAGMTGSITVA